LCRDVLFGYTDVFLLHTSQWISLPVRCIGLLSDSCLPAACLLCPFLRRQTSVRSKAAIEWYGPDRPKFLGKPTWAVDLLRQFPTGMSEQRALRLECAAECSYFLTAQGSVQDLFSAREILAPSSRCRTAQQPCSS
jgi:hypothetical protein